MKLYSHIFVCALALAACNASNEKGQKVSNREATSPMETKPEVATNFTASMVANKKDPICGMPVTAGINDTAHYDGKIYGFCASECKEDFKKTPLAYLKEME